MACPPKRAGHDVERKVLQPELISRVLFELRIGFDLGLRDREQNPERRVGCLGVPESRGKLAGANQIRPALAFRRHLVETLIQNRGAHLCLRHCRSWLRR